MKAYKIWCEWDMGFYEGYISKELAQKEINETDWEDLVGRTQQAVEDAGLVYVAEFEIKEERDELKGFIRDVTLALQDSSKHNKKVLFPLFQRAYKFYIQFDIEGRSKNTAQEGDEKDTIRDKKDTEGECPECGGAFTEVRPGRWHCDCGEEVIGKYTAQEEE